MKKDNTLQKLSAYGYERAENTITFDPEAPVYQKSFKEKTLNHAIMEHVKFIECDFDGACATGSIFRYCEFIDCSFDQPDFEFCEFYGCTFRSKTPLIVSFNESSFSESEFFNTDFRFCTFTGAFFDHCRFKHVSISMSSMENSLFRRCDFFNMDLRYLNLDFTEFDQPNMQDVVLPLDQIAFTFGGLQYLRDTKNSVKISKGAQNSISLKNFNENIVPLLCSHFQKSEQFFPLANLFFQREKWKKGVKPLKMDYVWQFPFEIFEC